MLRPSNTFKFTLSSQTFGKDSNLRRVSAARILGRLPALYPRRVRKTKPARYRMSKLVVALGVSAAVLLAGGGAWKADATTWRPGTLNLPGVTKNYSPIEKAACYGWGRHCPPGFTWRCGP